MLSVVMLSVVMLSVVMLSVVMLSVVMLSVVMLSVVWPCYNVCIEMRANERTNLNIQIFAKSEKRSTLGTRDLHFFLQN